MTHIIFYVTLSRTTPSAGTYGSTILSATLIWEDVLSASSLVSAINVGDYRFPLLPQPGPVFAAQHGELVLITRQTDHLAEINLSGREREVLSMLAEGRSAQQIAYLLGIKERTVAGHVLHLKERLGAGTREQAIARAVALGLYRPSLPG